MVMLGIDNSVYKWIHSPCWRAWSEGWQPFGAVLDSSDEPDKFSGRLYPDDSTIGIVQV